jgi:hypothetical protein
MKKLGHTSKTFQTQGGQTVQRATIRAPEQKKNEIHIRLISLFLDRRRRDEQKSTEIHDHKNFTASAKKIKQAAPWRRRSNGSRPDG